jgi:hypothetical protein
LHENFKKQIITKGESGTRAARQNTRKLFEINILTSNPRGAPDFAGHSCKPRASRGFSEGGGGGIPQPTGFPILELLKKRF